MVPQLSAVAMPSLVRSDTFGSVAPSICSLDSQMSDVNEINYSASQMSEDTALTGADYQEEVQAAGALLGSVQATGTLLGSMTACNHGETKDAKDAFKASKAFTGTGGYGASLGFGQIGAKEEIDTDLTRRLPSTGWSEALGSVRSLFCLISKAEDEYALSHEDAHKIRHELCFAFVHMLRNRCGSHMTEEDLSTFQGGRHVKATRLRCPLAILEGYDEHNRAAHKEPEWFERAELVLDVVSIKPGEATPRPSATATASAEAPVPGRRSATRSASTRTTKRRRRCSGDGNPVGSGIAGSSRHCGAAARAAGGPRRAYV